MYFTLISAKYIGLYSCVFCILQFFYCYVVNVAGAMYILAYPMGRGTRDVATRASILCRERSATLHSNLPIGRMKIKIRDHATNIVYFIAARFHVII